MALDPVRRPDRDAHRRDPAVGCTRTGHILDIGASSYVAKTLTFFVSFVIVYYVITSVVRTWHEIDTALALLVGCGTVVAVFALFEARTGINVFNHLSRIAPILHQHAGGYLVPRGGRLRALASAQHPIALGAMLVLLLPFVMYLCTQETARPLVAGRGPPAHGRARHDVAHGHHDARRHLVAIRVPQAAATRRVAAAPPVLVVVHLAVPGAVGA